MKPNWSSCLRALLIPLSVFWLRFSPAMAFNLDGKTDIVWFNKATGETAVWFMDFGRFSTSGRITNDFSAGWQVAATADFNRDGHTDLLWRDPATGRNEVWLMHGLNRVERQTLSHGAAEFYVVGTGDFNRDGYADILWRHKSEDLSAVWFMRGPEWSGKVGWLTQRSDTRWRPLATGDFNHDSDTDILWRHQTNGRVALWLMSETNLIRSVEIAAESDLNNRLVGTGQFNPVGDTDILWRHTNGANSLWRMSGTSRFSVTPLPTETNANWIVVGTGGYSNVMMLCATSSSSPAAITLRWQHGPAQLTNLEQKAVSAATWTNLLKATNHLPGRFTSTNISAGQRYEFKVGPNYLLSAVNGTPVENRGKVILIVENSAANALAADLNRLKTNLVGDGWTVVRTNVPRHNDSRWSANTNRIASIKAFITNTYYADPANTKAVFLIGHVPVPYSGFISPDGHGARALPADGYYGDVDGVYTDSQVNRRKWSPDPRNDNGPGDGKFDQSYYPNKIGGPGQLELAVGRIDFAKLPVLAPQSEMALLRRYLIKNDRYRRKQFTLPERVVVGTYFVPPAAIGLNRNVFAQALKNGCRLFGIAPGAITEGDALAATNSALWGFIGGNGLPYSIRGSDTLHTSQALSDPRKEPSIGFCAFYGSYHVDWDCTNNLMRTFLSIPRCGLAAFWFNAGYDGNRMELAFEQLGLGETLGSGFIRTANENPYVDMTHIALLGDPTLRMQILAPPAQLSAKAGTQVTLTWSASPDANTYFVYRSKRLDGPWEKVTSAPLHTTHFTDDAAPAGPKLYQVRAAKLIWTGSGSYTNLSQGIFASVR